MTLQGYDNDICTAMSQISSAICTIKQCHGDIDQVGDTLYMEDVALVKLFDASRPSYIPMAN